MRLHTIVNKTTILSDRFSYIGAFTLFTLMVLTTADVVGRYVFKNPIIGTYELTEYLVLITIFAFFPYTQSKDSNISVDILFERFPAKFQGVINLFNHLVCLFLMVLIIWQSIEKAMKLEAAGQASTNLSIPSYPFMLFVAVGCAFLCFEYIRNIVDIIDDLKSKRKTV